MDSTWLSAFKRVTGAPDHSGVKAVSLASGVIWCNEPLNETYARTCPRGATNYGSISHVLTVNYSSAKESRLVLGCVPKLRERGAAGSDVILAKDQFAKSAFRTRLLTVPMLLAGYIVVVHVTGF